MAQEETETTERGEDLTGQLDKLRTDVGGLKTADDVKRAVDEALESPGGSKIGAWRDSRTGRQSETDRFTVHYSKAGPHVVLSRPSGEAPGGTDN